MNVWPAWHRRNSSDGRGCRRYGGAAAAAQGGRRAGRHVLALRLDPYEWSTHTLPWSWHPSPPPLLVTALRGGQLGRGRPLQPCTAVAADQSSMMALFPTVSNVVQLLPTRPIESQI